MHVTGNTGSSRVTLQPVASRESLVTSVNSTTLSDLVEELEYVMGTLVGQPIQNTYLYILVRQEALQWQRGHATRLSVEILQLRYKTSHLKTTV